MKFSSGFTAFVVGSVAISNIASAAPVNSLASRDINQSNSQGTSQQASGDHVSQKSDSDQKNTQSVKYSKDDGLSVAYHGSLPKAPAPPAPAAPPAKGPSHHAHHHKDSGDKTGDVISIDALNGNNANAQVLGTGNQVNKRGGSTGDVISLPILNDNDANLQILGTGNQKNPKSNKKSHEDKKTTGDVISADILNGNNANAQILGTGNQSNKRGLPILSAVGQQSGSADGYGGSSSQAQTNKPVVSGHGNTVGTGGSQSATNDGTGGEVVQDLKQMLSARQLSSLFESAQGKQGASADGYGGESAQGQTNNPVLSGAGNSLTAGGAQQSQNNGQGGDITQDFLQKLQGRQFLGAQGSQGASADGFGGSSQQGQTNTPVLSGSGNSLTAGGAQQSQNNGQGGDITQDLLQKLQARQLFSQGKQGASADGFGGESAQGQTNNPVLSGAGNSLTAGGSQGAENDGMGGSIEQTLSQLQSLGGMSKRQLFAQGKQGASADGFGGSSQQGQTNTPVLSGAGNSLTAGGSQFGENNGSGGEVQQSLAQKLGLGKRQGGLFASGSQQGSAGGYGGSSFQDQNNRPVVSGAGNSVTTGGSQFGENDGTGGSVEQSLMQKLGFGKRQYESAFGSQGASADGFGGSSFQSQNNRPVVSGTGNSVTAGGAQGSENNGQGGSIKQGLQQLFGRQFQGLGQGIGQGIDQTGSANAKGGATTIVGQNGPSYVNGDATAGTVNQGAYGKQSGAQSATQGLSQQTQNQYAPSSYWRRQAQDLSQGINQGIKQNGQANAEGGSAYIAGGNGPAYVSNSATGGAVNQNGQAAQNGQQSGTQSLSQQFSNIFGRDLQAQGQLAQQGTKQSASADATGGPIYVTGGWTTGPTSIDSSAHAGTINQDSYSNQQDKQGAAQSSNENVHRRQVQTQVQGNSQDTSSNADASASANAGPYVASGYFWHHAPETFDGNTAVGGQISQNTQASQANKQGASQNARRSAPYAYGSQQGNANAQGGASYSDETNDKVVNGNGISSVQGGGQSADGSSTGGSISQLLQL